MSLGVAEHFEDGPHALLREAARVLRDGGVMVISVPWVSPLRRLPRWRPAGPPPGAAFYQYFFTRDEMVAAVQAAGFEVEAVDGYGTLKTLRDEWRELWGGRRTAPALSPAAAEAPMKGSDGRVGLVHTLRWAAHNALLENPLLHRVAAHMLLLVARRRPRKSSPPSPTQ
jgi:hypothetical protein